MKSQHFQIYVHIICVILLIAGGLNWGSIGVFNTNLVSAINKVTFDSPLFESSVYMLVGLATLYLAGKRNFYLPFLGDTVMAPSVLRDVDAEFKKTDITVTVDAPNAEVVMYWAADPVTETQLEGTQFAYNAYNKYENAGVAQVVGGKAVLKVNCPQTYWVKKWGVKKVLSKHLHYRLVYPTGWVSDVKTVKLNC